MDRLINSGVRFPDTAIPTTGSTYPIVEAHDVLVASDGQRLDDRLSKIPEMRYDTTTRVLTIIITE